MFTLGSDTAAAPVTPRSEDAHADDTSRAETAGTAAALDDVDLPDDTCATTSRGSCSLDVRPETVDTVPEVVAAEGTSTDEEDWGAHMATACAAEPDSEDDVSSDSVDVMVASVGASVTEDDEGVSASEGADSGTEDWDAEAAAAPAVIPAGVLVAAPAAVPPSMQGAGLTHGQVVDRFLGFPYLKQLGLYHSIVPMVQGEREENMQLRLEIGTYKKLLVTVKTYSKALEKGAAMHYERAVAEYGAHTSMGDQPSVNLEEWIEDMRRDPLNLAARLIDDWTRYDIIVRVQDSKDILQAKYDQLKKDVDSLSRALHQERRERMLTRDALDEALETIAAGAARQGDGHGGPSMHQGFPSERQH